MQYLLSVVVLICVGLNLAATTDFRNDGLVLHNKYRGIHHSPPLTLSKKLNDYAQSWAQTMANADELEHSETKYGENIYMTGDTEISDFDAVKEATKLWYDEVVHYDYNNPGFTMETGHFTQVVWKNSKNLGLGVARSSNGNVYVCGTYDPPGNYEGQFEKNVFKQ